MSETSGITVPSLTAEGFQRVESQPRSGVEKYFYTPNMCDKTAWWEGSTRQVGIALSSADQQIWASGYTYWIDLKHGRVFKEDDVPSAASYHAVVETSTDLGVTWTTKTEKDYDSGVGDYTINYATGVVTFASPLPADAQVRASFSQAGEFNCIIAPSPGKRLKLNYVEIQYTKDLVMSSSVKFEIWVYNPIGDGSRVKYGAERYKRLLDFYQESTGPFPSVAAHGGARGFASDLFTIPFNYLAYRGLNSSDGAQIRVKLGNPATAFAGEFANATFYCLTEDE